MIGIILGAIIFAIIISLVKNISKENREPLDKVDIGATLFISVCAAIILDFIAWGIFSCTAVKTVKSTEVVSSEKIVALQDNATVTGAITSNFFLFSGTMGNKCYYAFYCETETGFKYRTLDAESPQYPVYIKYLTSDYETPRIDQYSVVERKSLKTDINPIWFSVSASIYYSKYSAGEIFSEEATNQGYSDDYRYEIHIPEGSIKTDYTIDLE